MSTRKRNEFLEGDDSEEEELGNGYDSDEQEQSRGDIGGQRAKRRKLDDASDAESQDDIGDEDRPNTLPLNPTNPDSQQPPNPPSADEDQPQPQPQPPSSSKPKSKSKKKKPYPLTPFEKAEHKTRRSGVLYISRVPPFMKPSTLRNLLTPHAPSGLNRLFLTPENSSTHASRVRQGGNKKKSYADGWVEFVSKKEAKIAAELLNGGIMGGKKGGFYHDDLWCLKYLRGFKWRDLNEQIAAENAERTVRMREEVRRTRKENRAFVMDVERGKMLEGMERKRAGRAAPAAAAGDKGREKKEFKQKTAVKVKKGDDSGPSDQMGRMRSMIF